MTELRLSEIENNPNFKHEIEHDEREGVYENCVYHMKNGHQDFLFYGDGCKLHYYKNGILVEKRTPNIAKNNLQKLAFYNNQGKILFEVNNYENDNQANKSFCDTQATHLIDVVVFENCVVVEEKTFDFKPICATSYDVLTGLTDELTSNGVQLSFDF